MRNGVQNDQDKSLIHYNQQTDQPETSNNTQRLPNSNSRKRTPAATRSNRTHQPAKTGKRENAPTNHTKEIATPRMQNRCTNPHSNTRTVIRSELPQEANRHKKRIATRSELPQETELP
jgi:hypothetical protein